MASGEMVLRLKALGEKVREISDEAKAIAQELQKSEDASDKIAAEDLEHLGWDLDDAHNSCSAYFDGVKR